MPSCIAEVPTGDVLVLCHENPSKYGFSSAFKLSLIYLVFTFSSQSFSNLSVISPSFGL